MSITRIVTRYTNVLCLLTYFYLLHDVMVDVDGESRLTVKPRNTVALAGDRVVLRCATDRASERNGNPITWSFGSQKPACRPKRDHCDLVIDSLRSSDAGGYDCSDGGSKTAQASLIVVGKISKNCISTHTRWCSG